MLAALSLGLAVVAGSAQSAEAAESGPVWTEVNWPFLIDEWGTGRAFVCKAADCGGDIALYLRVKAGFCNCATGVTDDDDLDRVGDLKLLSEAFIGLANGRSIVVDGMNGRSRPYNVSLPLWRSQTAVAMVLHAKCDAVVATVVADRDRLAAAEQNALVFLNHGPVLEWAKVTLGW
jgi:hypothetical protein